MHIQALDVINLIKYLKEYIRKEDLQITNKREKCSQNSGIKKT